MPRAQSAKPSPPPLPEGRERRSSTAAEVLERAKLATIGIKVGRPRTYSPELCKRALALGMAGKSWAAIAREFGISRQTLHKWEGEYPEFSDALSRARAAAQAWWEDDIQESRQDKHYQAQAVGKLMGAQFEDYREQRATGLEALPDFLAAITAVADQRRAPKAIPGDDAKAIEAEILPPEKDDAKP